MLRLAHLAIDALIRVLVATLTHGDTLAQFLGALCARG
ncbi:hypothetical protein HAL011_07860 [Helicobacter ailurogastricus]|uniref:Uncharacterized protein n=1 Tax=Helicobacter ailurogastricus TaxID=1578720 RepID=A0A0K2X2S8_9HELI|nr:hypothetical protein HAL011_07860 [Helicobacter ailurogastricus]